MKEGADTTSRETVIASIELNKKKTERKNKGEARKGKREKTRGRSRPANQTLLNFPPVSSSPDNKEGQL